jgi:hypothetical protein
VAGETLIDLWVLFQIESVIACALVAVLSYHPKPE